MARTKSISDASVLDAAVGVMFRRGQAFTLTEVAQAAGIAPATLLQRFGEKQGLIVAALAHDNRRFAAQVAEAPRASGREAVIDLFWAVTPTEDAQGELADQILWLRQDLGDPRLRELAQERSAILRAAVAERLPPLAIAPATAVRLLEAQWQGALTQWAIERHGVLADYVAESLEAWFELAGAGAPAP